MPDTKEEWKYLAERYAEQIEADAEEITRLRAKLAREKGEAAFRKIHHDRQRLVSQRFQSGNDVEVDRVVITREEWFGGESK